MDARMNSQSVQVMTRREPRRSSSRPPSAAPIGAGNGQHDAEEAELHRAPAEHCGGIDAAEGEHRAETVGVQHARDEEAGDLFVIAQEFAHALEELSEAGADCTLFARRTGTVWREQKERQHEDEIPERGERSDETVAFAARSIEWDQGLEAEKGLAGVWVGRNQTCEQHEAQETADISRRPAEPREAAEPVFRHEGGHHGVGEHGRELGTHDRDGEA